MRGLAIGAGIAAVLLLVSGGHLLFVPLLFIPFGLLTLRRPLAALRVRPHRRNP